MLVRSLGYAYERLTPKVQHMSGYVVVVTTTFDFMALNDGPNSLRLLLGQLDICSSRVDGGT